MGTKKQGWFSAVAAFAMNIPRKALKYDGLTGALLGAMGTILAGLLALTGVNDQIREQRSANRIAELTYIDSFTERLQKEKLLLVNLELVWDSFSDAYSSAVVAVSTGKIPNPATKAIEQDRSDILQLDDSRVSALRDGLAGELGVRSYVILRDYHRIKGYLDSKPEQRGFYRGDLEQDSAMVITRGFALRDETKNEIQRVQGLIDKNLARTAKLSTISD